MRFADGNVNDSLFSSLFVWVTCIGVLLRSLSRRLLFRFLVALEPLEREDSCSSPVNLSLLIIGFGIVKITQPLL